METNNNLSSQASANLNEAAKWANIIAIIGFVGIGLSLLSFLFVLKGMPGPILVGYLIALVLYTIPYYYMFKFASEIKNSNTDNGVANLKAYFKFIAILTIVTIALSILGALFIVSMF